MIRPHVVYILVLAALFSVNSHAGIATTKHNLSASGPGDIKAETEERICIFCHIAHEASPDAPLWNRKIPGLAYPEIPVPTYLPYRSSTAVAAPGQPTGSSILCLSCHDGTIALGDVVQQGPIDMIDSATGSPVTMMPITAGGNLGTDLSDDHPISFLYSSAIPANTTPQENELEDPVLLDHTTGQGPVRLDATGQVQCRSCHDPHDNALGSFLVVGKAELCVTCHKKTGWVDSPHNNANACQSCHKSHTAGQAERLLAFAEEERNCVEACHNGSNGGGPDVWSDINKASAHPVMDYQGMHDLNEPAIVSDPQHVECADCHDPHVTASPADPFPNIEGVDIDGTVVDTISSETDSYQLCFRCHGDNSFRQTFDPTSNKSYHPVVGEANMNFAVPSLVDSNMTRVSCIDCHASDGAGAAGPHGSNISPLLKKDIPELCFDCHRSSNILGDNSFDKHKKHIEDENTNCNVCHVSHGVANGPRLINFDISIAQPLNGVVNYTQGTSQYSGHCTLSCHGKDDHDQCAYGNISANDNCP